VPRPFLTWSIAQLEAEFERAQDEGDTQVLGHLVHELSFRTTAKADALRQSVQKFLGRSDEQRSEPDHLPPVRPQVRSATRGPSGAQRQSAGARSAPTEEQRQAIECFSKGGSLKINAYAGTGKTSTLEFIAHSTPQRGQYIAFNRSIVREAQDRFPSSVNCATSHGLAFRATPSQYKSNKDKMAKRMNANQLADILNLKRWQMDRAHVLQPRSQGYLILETLRRFMHSADAEPATIHVPRHGSLVSAPEPTMKAVTDFALHAAKYVWARMKDPNDPIPLGHDGYLKLWAQTNPVIAADYILLDEAQDTNPVVLDVLRKQSAQMIYVGDKYQQIYEWRGAVNAMEKIRTDADTYLTMSFRFGPVIAQAASKLLSTLNEKRPLKGNPAVVSSIGHVAPCAILARTNASAITAIIECLDTGKKPHLVGGTDEVMDMLRGVQDLKEGKQSTVPDFFGFDKWEQVVEFAKSGEGDHLLTFVNLVESRGERQLMWALNRTVDEERSNIVISTAHKAKGREWSTVRLMDDFARTQPKSRGKAQTQGNANGHDPAEVRLLYVALTRSKQAVDVPSTMLPLLS
jgi:AAA domain